MTTYGWAECPQPLRDHIASFVQQMHGILVDELTGIYLHGSLALGCFNPGQSDIDLLVITQQIPRNETLVDIAQALLDHSGTSYAYDVILIHEGSLFPWRYPVPYTFHFNESGRHTLQANLNRNLGQEAVNTPGQSHDLAAHIKLLHERGTCLYGRPISYTLPRFPEAQFIDALTRSVRNARDTMMQNPPHTILNQLRVYHYLHESIISSKDEAGQWALESLPESQHEVINYCLQYYRGQKDVLPFDPIDLARTTAYLDAKISELLLRREGR